MSDMEAHRGYIEAALEYAGGTHTFEDVQEAVTAGRLQFWPGPHSAVITEIVDYPRQRVINFFLAGGNLAELEAMQPALLDWGRAQGCTSATFTGRKGWERTFLTRDGWKSKLVVFEKAL
jgi:hypothetical protein